MNGAIEYAPANWHPKHVRRNQVIASITSVGGQLIGANPNRIGLVVGCPNQDFAGSITRTQLQSNVDTSVAGVKPTYTVPGGLQAICYGATQVETTGTGVITDLELVRVGNPTKIARLTTTQSFTGRVDLIAADVIRLNVTTAVVASVCDMSLDITETALNNRVTLSINTPVSNDAGIMLYPGNEPLVLWREVIGDALTEDIFAKSAGANVTICVWDLFH